MKTKLSVLLCGAVCAAASFTSATAATLVSWGPSTDYVTANQATSRTSAGGVISFNMDTALSPSSGYTGGAFYGGASATTSLNGGFSVVNNNATNGGGNDAVLFGRTGATIGDQVTGAFMWKQSDFLSNTTGSVTLESLSFTGRVNGVASVSESRWIIQQGDSYMISGSLALTTSITSYSATDLSALTWYDYTPDSGLSSMSGVAIAEPTFTGVTAAGLYLTATRGTSVGDLYLAFSAFGATGSLSTVPEPSAVAALAGMAVLGMVAVRRRVRRS